MVFTYRDVSLLTPCRIPGLGPALKVPMTGTLMQELGLIHAR